MPEEVAEVKVEESTLDASETTLNEWEKHREDPKANPLPTVEEKTVSTEGKPSGPKSGEESGEGKPPEQSGAPDTPGGEEEEPKPGEKPVKKVSRRSKRIESLSRRLRETEVELEAERQKNAKPPAADDDTPEEPEAADPGIDPSDPRPDMEDFETAEDHSEAMTEWVLRKQSRADTVASQQEALRTHHEKIQQGWEEQLETAKEAHSDFDEAMESGVMVPKATEEAIMGSEVGAEIAYHLAKNPEEAESLFGLSPVGQIRAIGRIEARLAPHHNGKGQQQEPRVSNAPKPITPVGGKAGVGPKDFSLMSLSEYEEWRAGKT